MAATGSVRNLPKTRREEPYLRSSNLPRKIITSTSKDQIFRFNKILIMHAHALKDLTQLDPKDVVSVGGKLIIGSPYNN
jgi:hypothetical protein